MKQFSLYNEDIWARFCEKIGSSPSKFKLKTYVHFDKPFNFLKRSKEIKRLVSDPSLQKIAHHAFLPFVKILFKIPKYKYQETEHTYELETKVRPIAFASHFDTYLYSFYSFAINEKYQAYIKQRGFDESIIAYRTDLNGKCNIQFAKEVFKRIKGFGEAGKSCTVISLDIKGYFDNIEHNILKTEWAKVLGENQLPIDQYTVFKSLTKYSYVNKNSILRHFYTDFKKNSQEKSSLLDLIDRDINGASFNDKFNLLRSRNLIALNRPKKGIDTLSNRGIPQGSAMSALLSNIYLIEFDDWLFKITKENGWFYRRYCDDLLIICDTDAENSLYKQIIEKILDYKVEVQTKKTEIIEFKLNSKNQIRALDKIASSNDNVIINLTNEHLYYKNLQYLGFEYNGVNTYIRHTSLSRYFRKAKARITKSIIMAYSHKSIANKIYRKSIYEKYTFIGKRNFIQYCRNAANKTYTNSQGVVRDGMDSISIKRQISAHFSIIEREIDKTSKQYFCNKTKINRRRSEAGKRIKAVVQKN